MTGNRSLNSLDALTTEELDFKPLDNCLSFLETTDSRQIIQSIATQKIKQAIELSRNNQEQAEQYNRVIQEIVGWEIKFKLEAKPFNLFLEIDHKRLEFDVLPDGLKSIISLLADLIRRLDKIEWINNRNILERHFILFLDEIDIHQKIKQWEKLKIDLANLTTDHCSFCDSYPLVAKNQQTIEHFRPRSR